MRCRIYTPLIPWMRGEIADVSVAAAVLIDSGKSLTRATTREQHRCTIVCPADFIYPAVFGYIQYFDGLRLRVEDLHRIAHNALMTLLL